MGVHACYPGSPLTFHNISCELFFLVLPKTWHTCSKHSQIPLREEQACCWPEMSMLYIHKDEPITSSLRGKHCY